MKCKELVKPILIATRKDAVADACKPVQGIGKTNSNCNIEWKILADEGECKELVKPILIATLL